MATELSSKAHQFKSTIIPWYTSSIKFLKSWLKPQEQKLSKHERRGLVSNPRNSRI